MPCSARGTVSDTLLSALYTASWAFLVNIRFVTVAVQFVCQPIPIAILIAFLTTSSDPSHQLCCYSQPTLSQPVYTQALGCFIKLCLIVVVIVETVCEAEASRFECLADWNRLPNWCCWLCGLGQEFGKTWWDSSRLQEGADRRLHVVRNASDGVAFSPQSDDSACIINMWCENLERSAVTRRVAKEGNCHRQQQQVDISIRSCHLTWWKMLDAESIRSRSSPKIYRGIKKFG